LFRVSVFVYNSYINTYVYCIYLLYIYGGCNNNDNNSIIIVYAVKKIIQKRLIMYPANINLLYAIIVKYVYKLVIGVLLYLNNMNYDEIWT